MKAIEMLMNKDYTNLFNYIKEDDNRISELYYEDFEGWERDSCIWFAEFLEQGLGDYYNDEIFQYEDVNFFVRTLKDYFKPLDRAMEGYKSNKYKSGDFIIYNNSILFLVDGFQENYYYMKTIGITGTNGVISNDKSIRLATDSEKELFAKNKLDISNKYKTFIEIEKELKDIRNIYDAQLKKLITEGEL